MKQLLTALIAGLLFGAGLTISMMVDPERVLDFLDIFGDWDPTLAFVMGGGLAVYLPIFHFVVKPRKTTVFGESCDLPSATKVDSKLLGGSVLFGLGWGLSGICPGPALSNLSGGLTGIFVFVATMILGMLIAGRLTR
ncbi:YeeE/YedE family protein [Alteromonas sp. ASW11-19]|uniref:YeeE/YedE family protein n=1 Tax=Alteromonas salexigens TaxID=2982530 RepID=A0ABT2VJ61_9ALTE|nr:DUF6691 family protein [Alteromonas salexigens]MCU7553206.1 YeeE/YedE family protein [Alteromonas salexigens]